MADNVGISEYAAVAIPTLCRYEHLKRCITSLQRNSFAKYTDLYISVDYPPSAKYEEGYKRICDYLDCGVEGFNKVYVIKQKENLGAFGNLDYMYERVFKDHTRIIFSEDDNEFSDIFLKYMNILLEKYEDDPEINAISGYNYPINSEDWNGNIYFNSAYCAYYGHATWLHKYKRMSETLTVKWLDSLYKNWSYIRKLRRLAPNQYCNFVKSYLGYRSIPLICEGKVLKIDIVCGLYTFSTNMNMIFPTVSKARNWGFDGSGSNCDTLPSNEEQKSNHRNFDFSKQLLYAENDFEEIKVCNNTQQEVLKAVDGFFEIPKRELFRTDLAYIFSRLFGVEYTRKFLKGK